MKTSKDLIFEALVILSNEEISLEEALFKATKNTGLTLNDDIRIVRDFLREKDLIKHNPRLTYPGHRENVGGTINFVYDKIDENFINDHVTENCRDLIYNKTLQSILFE
jgi:hypothetical protein